MASYQVVDLSGTALRYLTGVLGVLMAFLFTIGVFDVGIQVVELITSGRFTEPVAIVGILDSVLLLLIVLEVFRDLEAYVRGENLLPIIIEIGIIAVIRKIIITQTEAAGTSTENLYFAVSSLLLLVALFVGYFLVETYEPGDSTAEPEQNDALL